MQTATLKTVLGRLVAQAGADAMRDLSDAELLERFRGRREEAAFALLVQRHGPMVLGVCRRVLRDLHAAEDAFQDTFLVLVRKADSIRQQRSLASWLYGVAQRTAVRARTQSAERHRCERESVVSQSSPDALEALTRAELQAVLDEEIGRLPDKYRGPLVLCCLEGKTHEQAAQEMVWPKSSVTARLKRARELLRQRLVRRGVALPGSVVAALLAEQTAAQATSAHLTLATVRRAVEALVDQVATATTAVTLAGGMVKGLTTTKLAAALALLLAVGLAVAGVGVLASPKEEPKTETPPRETRHAPPKPEPVEAARTDRHGDPLPDGVLARMDSGRLRHGGFVRVLSFSPDGKALVSASEGRLRLWDAATGKLQRRIDFERGEWGFVLAFSADGICVASGDRKKEILTVQFFNPADGKVRRRVEINSKEATGALALTTDGTRLALTMSDSVRLYDSANGQETLRISCKANSLVFSPDAKSIATGDFTDTVKLYSTTDGKILRELKHEGDRIRDIGFSPDGRSLATIAWDDTKNEGEASIWDLTTGKERHRLKGPGGYVLCAVFSPDGNYLAMGCQHHDLVLWDLTIGKEVRRFPTDAFFGHVAFSPDGKAVAAVSGEGTIRLWEVATGRVLPASADPFMNAFGDIRFSASGKQLVGTASKLIAWWDPATGREIRRLPSMPDSSGRLSLSPDESLVASQSKVGMIQLWDAQTKREVRTLKGHEGWVWSALFSSDGKRMISGGFDGAIRVWDVATGRELHKLTGRPDYAGRLAASPDGHWLASSSDAKGPQGSYEVILWDLTTAREKRRFALTRERRAYQLAFSPDSHLLAAVGGSHKVDEPGEAKVWDVASGKEWQSFEGLKQRVGSVSFSPDGRMLATGAGDGTLVLWELASGRRRHQFIGHENWIYSIAFSSDGRQMAAASIEAPVYVWDIADTLQPRRLKLSATELERCWADLGGEDAEAAFRAVRLLGAAPDRALPFLRDRLKPVRAADPKRLAQLLKSLDSAEFAERQQAATELEKLADADASTLRRTAHDTSSAEVRRALQDILDRLEAATPEQLRVLRAVEAVEWMATPEAVKLLGRLTTGADDARLTCESKSAVKRLKAKQE